MTGDGKTSRSTSTTGDQENGVVATDAPDATAARSELPPQTHSGAAIRSRDPREPAPPGLREPDRELASNGGPQTTPRYPENIERAT